MGSRTAQSGNLFEEPEFYDLGHGAWLRYWPKVVDNHVAVLEALLSELPLQEETLKLFGRDLKTPRRTGYFGDKGCSYTYSRRNFSPRPWSKGLLQCKRIVEASCGASFNAALANHYRKGDDAMGFHADDEAEVGPTRDNRLIASLSLGAPRRFVLRLKRAHRAKEGLRREPLALMLGGGDLLVMGGTTQSYFEHGIPKTAKPCGERLNLTFRVINPKP